MDSLEKQYGYDANFVDNVLDFFKCVVCHLVLKEPVQIMSCGHRFCKPCFERLQGYSKHLNTDLCCPIDRELVDVNKVFEDTGMAREIGNFLVKCSSLNEGCLWQGDLRSLQEHEENCQHKMKVQREQKPECVEEDWLMKEVLQRLTKCEESLLEKEKELAHVKHNIPEIKSFCDRKEREMDSLQRSNTELQDEVNMMKKLNKEMTSNFMKEIIVLKDENKSLVTRLNKLERQVIETNNALKEEKTSELFEKETEDLKNIFTDKLSSEHNDNIERQIEKSLKPVHNELLQIKKDIQKTFNEIRALRSHTDKTVNKKDNEIRNITTRLQATEKLLEKDDAKELSKHLDNIENVLFSYMPYNEKEMTFKWVLTDYKYNFQEGEAVESPIFFPQINGYCFKIRAAWVGERNEMFGLFLKLCRGRNVHANLKRFRVPYEFAILRKDGTYRTQRITYAVLDDDDCLKYFSLLPYQQEAEKGVGTPQMFTKREVYKYLINDALYISCTLLC